MVKLTATTQGSMKLVYEDGDELEEEFAAYPKCGRLEHGFLRVRCEDCPLHRRGP